MTAACIHCNNTGSLSKDLAGHLDCAHCTVANERAELEKWAKENRVSYVTETDLWMIFQHGRQAVDKELSDRLAHMHVTDAQANAVTGFAQAMVDCGIVQHPRFMDLAAQCADRIRHAPFKSRS